MPINNISPKQFQESVHRGAKRLKAFRKARLMFLRQYVGQYYDAESGSIGDEPLNLIFNAIRTLVPNIVMSFPTHKVSSRFLASKSYAELLSLALQYHDRSPDIREVYRRAIVDAIFTLGIVKTGLCESDSVYAFDEYDRVDTGQIYTECVDFDNFVVDPASRQHLFRDAAYLGDRIIIPRANLLESGLYKNDLVERLPSVAQEMQKNSRAELISKNRSDAVRDYDMQDEVEIIELWVPSANATVTVPGSMDMTTDDYLRVDDYYGPDEGPYSLLTLTPPVSGNPLPVPMVGIWYDLHVLSNRMAKKVINQATRQKDVLLYRRAAADDAQEVVEAGDGESIGTDDPSFANVLSLGGQRQSNEIHLAQLQGWFNQMSANPQAMSGQRFDAESATEARILQMNANVGLEDMKDMVYQLAATEARKRAWYMHTDPLIEVPLIQRQQIPAEYQQTTFGPRLSQPAQVVDVQVMLTPEARRGDFLDFTFSVEPESMGRKDSQTRLAEAMDFAVKIIPAAAQAASTMAMLGIPFSAKEFIIKMAEDRGITWMDQVFFDPEYQAYINQLMLQGPDPMQSKGVLAPNAGAGMGAILQNGQPGQVMANPAPRTRERQDEQQGANPAQQALQGGY